MLLLPGLSTRVRYSSTVRFKLDIFYFLRSKMYVVLTSLDL